MLRPLEDDCRLVQFAEPLSDDEYGELSKLLETRPSVELRAYGSIQDLEFLRHFPRLKHFQVDEASALNDLSGLRFLSTELESLAIGARLSKLLSLKPLSRFSGLRRLYVEGPIKDIDLIGVLTTLRDLTLRSITLGSLEILRPLEHLLLLDIKLEVSGILAICQLSAASVISSSGWSGG